MRRVRLGDHARTQSGGTPSRSNRTYYEGKIPWFKSGELTDGILQDSEEHISEAALDDSSAKLVPSGTLLMAMYGATVGRLGVLSQTAATNQAICAIQPSEALDRDFLFYTLLEARAALIESSFGGA
jgi:type I restriction enzyme, S subunit